MKNDNRYGWLVVGNTLINQGLSMGILLAGYALFVIPWIEEFNVPRSQAMLGSTLILVLNSLMSPVAGKLMDKLGLRTLILIGVGCLGAGMALVSFASAFWMILLAYATLLPVAIVFCGSLSSQTLVSKWFNEGRGIALGVSSLGSSFGGFILPAVIAALIGAYSWRTSLLILAVLCLVVMIPANALILRRNPPEAGAGDQKGGSAPPSEPDWKTSDLLKRSAFWIPVLAFIPLMAGFTGTQFNLGAYVSDLGYDQGLAAKLITVLAVGQVVGKLSAGSLAEKIDHRIIYWVMAGLMGLSLFLFAGGPKQGTLYAASFIMGTAAGATLPMLPIVYASRFGTRSIGVVLGLVTLVLIVGSFGSFFAGMIYDKTQSYDAAFLVFGLLLIPVSIGMFFLHSPAKSKESWPSQDSKN